MSKQCHKLQGSKFCCVIGVFLLLLTVSVRSDEFRGVQFIGLTNFSQFRIEENGTVVTFISPEIRPDIRWDEMVPSWNYRGDGGMSIDVRVRYGDHSTEWYQLGKWAADPEKYARESTPGQKDEDGTVLTDTLRMKRPRGALEVRIQLQNREQIKGLKFLGLSLSEGGAGVSNLPPNQKVWGKELKVPERSQVIYPEGINEWCSPTAVAMLLGYWKERLGRPELERDVPEVARGVNDPKWPGTGNWPFNTAYAGMHEGIRAYVTRFTDVREVEDWIEAEIPIALSVAYGLLKGDVRPGNGHLIVCIGFTESGDLIVNDPGRRNVRQIYRRADFVRAWRESRNTVYLIYPERGNNPGGSKHWFGE